MNHLKEHIARLMAGESNPTHGNPELRAIVDEVHASVRDAKARQELGLYVLHLVSASLKSSLLTERAVMRAKGGPHAE